jgi:hypothetical protein
MLSPFDKYQATKYKIYGENVLRVLPSGYWRVNIRGNVLRADTINGLKQLARKYK